MSLRLVCGEEKKKESLSPHDVATDFLHKFFLSYLQLRH